MNLEEIGAFLKAEREKRQLSIADVAGRLKINQRLLMALEAGNEAALPHRAYVRGFIRSYAGLLGIGQAETRSLLEGVIPSEPVETEAQEKIEPPEPGSRRGGGKFVIIPLLVCALAGIGYWLWQTGFWESAMQKQNSSADMEDKLPSADAYLAAKEAEKSKSEHEGGEKALQVDPVQPARRVLPSQPPAAATVPAPVQTEPEAVAVPETKAVAPAQHKLVITAIEECWVHSNADKTDTRQFSLRKGDTFALTFSKSLELKLGNAGGVRFRYDGNELPPPGTSGQVKTVTFPPAVNAD